MSRVGEHGPTETQDDRAMAIEALNNYGAAFSSLEPERVVPYYHEPLTFITHRTVPTASVLATRADIEAWLKPVLQRLKRRGYARTTWAELHVKQLNDGLVVASGLAVRYKEDGEELERVATTYVLRKTSDRWKIVVLILHDPGSVLRLD